MKNQKYKSQVKLLLDVLPEVAKEACFALHGGTAINLFIRDMPRLSIDIDLTYLPIEDRQTSLQKIDEALLRIKTRLERILPQVQIQNLKEAGKLLIRSEGREIKIEVNLIMRGVLGTCERMILCNKAQDVYDVSVVMPIVPRGQLYGGKICAALDRQHPRDLFDIKYLLENEGFSDEIRQGFLYCLLCSERPINELIDPNFLDQNNAMQNQFLGMSDEPFTYDEFERIRTDLIRVIQNGLNAADKDFLLSIKNCEPDWRIYDLKNYPAIQWKLQNLQKLKLSDPSKHIQLYNLLKKKLGH